MRYAAVKFEKWRDQMRPKLIIALFERHKRGKNSLSGERKSEIFYQSCKVHFIAFQTNGIELRAAEKTHVHVVSPGQTSRAREKESKVKKA